MELRGKIIAAAYGRGGDNERRVHSLGKTTVDRLYRMITGEELEEPTLQQSRERLIEEVSGVEELEDPHRFTREELEAIWSELDG